MCCLTGWWGGGYEWLYQLLIKREDYESAILKMKLFELLLNKCEKSWGSRDLLFKEIEYIYDLFHPPTNVLVQGPMKYGKYEYKNGNDNSDKYFFIIPGIL